MMTWWAWLIMAYFVTGFLLACSAEEYQEERRKSLEENGFTYVMTNTLVAISIIVVSIIWLPAIIYYWKDLLK